MGVEPTSQPWEGRILPMKYTRKSIMNVETKQMIPTFIIAKWRCKIKSFFVIWKTFFVDNELFSV